MAAGAVRNRGNWQPVAAGLLLALLWHVAAIAAGSRLFPGPVLVLETVLAETATGELPEHLAITLARVLASFAIAMTIGMALGMLMGRLRWADAFLQTWLTVFLNLPALVVIILCYIWLGLTEAALLAAVAISKVPNVAVTIRQGTLALERDYEEMAQVYRLGRLQAIRHVVLPQLAPYILASARNGLALVWKIVLLVELLGRSNGVGFQLHSYFQLFDVPRVLAYAAAFIACVMLIELAVLAPLEARAGRWRR